MMWGLRSSAATRMGRAAALLLFAIALVGAVPAAAQTSAELAIQDVVQRGNAAQAQALASGDVTLLTETALGSYRQQLVRTNQSLLDAGVTNIELVELLWGP